jgi:hypothetical protein
MPDGAVTDLIDNARDAEIDRRTLNIFRAAPGLVTVDEMVNLRRTHTGNERKR